MMTNESFPCRSHTEPAASQSPATSRWSQVVAAVAGWGAPWHRRDRSHLSGAMICHAEMDGKALILRALDTPPPPRKSLILRLWETLEAWAERRRGRRELAGLDDRILKDMGICSIDALKESSKPFWLK